MTAAVPDKNPSQPNAKTVSISDSLILVTALLDQAPDSRLDADLATSIADQLRILHVGLRSHWTTIRLDAQDVDESVSPEFIDARKRLDAEYPRLLGMLDRLIRDSETICDRTLEDQEVFLLRGRELIAFARRHEAEEDSLFFLAVWRDTGGEAG